MARIWGKVIGGFLGFAVGGGPLGAVLGVAAGHAYDQRRLDGFQWEELAPKKSIFGGASSDNPIFTSGIIPLGAKMAKANGRVTREKVDAFKRAFNIRPEDEVRVGRMFDHARRSPEGFEPYAFTLAQKFAGNPSALEDIMGGLFKIAGAGTNSVTPVEADFLRSVAFTFNFGPDVFQRIAQRSGMRMPTDQEMRDARVEVRRDGGSDPFTVLSIKSTASNDEVKAAYKNLIRKHHPDKMIAEGKTPDFIATANEKMKRINIAYDTICKMRGIK